MYNEKNYGCRNNRRRERDRQTDREIRTGYITLKPQMNSPLSNKKRTLTYF